MSSINKGTAYIEKLTQDVNDATNCAAIQGYVNQLVKEIQNTIDQKSQSISNIASDWAPLVSLPADPLKILTWAAKVVAGPIGTQVALMAQQAIELAELASALAGLANAVATAADRLQQCTEAAVLGALKDIENSLLAEAEEALAFAEQLKQDILDKTGVTDVTDTIDGVVDDVISINDSVDNIENVVGDLPG
jgi:uncharacterized protein YoxC